MKCAALSLFSNKKCPFLVLHSLYWLLFFILERAQIFCARAQLQSCARTSTKKKMRSRCAGEFFLTFYRKSIFRNLSPLRDFFSENIFCVKIDHYSDFCGVILSYEVIFITFWLKNATLRSRSGFPNISCARARAKAHSATCAQSKYAFFIAQSAHITQMWLYTIKWSRHSAQQLDTRK